MQLSLSTTFVALAALFGTVVGEFHTVRLNNRCGLGTVPILQARNGSVLSTGPDYTSDGPLIGAIAYVQHGKQCGLGGENCTVIKTTLQNGLLFLHSSTTFDVSPPHVFTSPAAFSYFNGCDGSGGHCNGPRCPARDVSVECREKNVGLSISFCT